MADFIHTFTGKHFEPLNPNPDLIDIRDIAHALSMQCRYVGHCRDLYSVGEHSVRVSQACANKDALAGLLHDAPEAYLHDLARPIKRAEGMEKYREAEDNLWLMIARKFDLPAVIPGSVHRADNLLLNTEARDLFDRTPAWADRTMVQPHTIRPLTSPRAAETWFMERFRALTRAKVAA